MCGGSGVVSGDVLARIDEQTLADRDQTASDEDQTWSDQDQTASDRDAGSAGEDQDASDEDFAAGGDPGVHERTRLAREHAASRRDEVSGLRGESAVGRLAGAEERDRIAGARDREAVERDRAATESERQPDASFAEVRVRAERDRAQAAADRARAAADREAAARERDEARRALASARREIVAAATDELTGAWTRRFGLMQIGREIERARRSGGTLTVAFVDVDRLKEVNDREGHAAGDQLLRQAAMAMQETLRPYDVVVRYGGDEFLCAMPNISRDAALERLTAIAAALTAAGSGHSITFGLAEHRLVAVNLEDLIARADADMLATRHPREQDTGPS
jgi:diguanylate cyclase (GGDEF)-like protein